MKNLDQEINTVIVQSLENNIIKTFTYKMIGCLMMFNIIILIQG